MMNKNDALSIVDSEYYSTVYLSPIGLITLISDNNSIVGLYLEDQKNLLSDLHKEYIIKEDIPVLIKAKEWLRRYFAKENPEILDLPLAPMGTEFRKIVWKILCDIPYGEVATYGDVSKKVALIMRRDKMSAQAIGGAIKHNPISIIIPCHRVIGSDGNMTGYSGGISKKIKLLELEGRDNIKFKG